VVVEAATVTVTDGAVISSTTAGPGRGGRVTVRATEAIRLAGPSGITSDTLGTGAGGTVTVEAAQVSIADGAVISGSTTGPGRGGDVTVRATDLVAISGPASGLFTGTESSGTGGDIALHAPQIQLTDSAAISAESTGLGNAGNITLEARDTFRSRHSTVTTATRQADGGNITLHVGALMRLSDSQLTTTVQGGEGRGGNITIDPRFVLLERSQIRADAAGGPGGNVRLSAGVFLADPASRITASSARNLPGEITIQAPITNLSGLVTPLAPDFASAAALLHDPCVARLYEGTVSSFVVRERASLPASYDGLLPTRLYEPQGHQAPAAEAGPPAWQRATAPMILPGATAFPLLRLDSPCARP
jgi:large exoprotein involved in heme utilization and adhesion